MTICAICNESISSQEKDYVKIGYVGAKSINEASLLRGGNLGVVKGNFVHISCRRCYINKKYISLLLKKEDHSEKQPNLRSSGMKYDIKNECIFCGHPDKYNKKKLQHKLTQVITYEFEESLLDTGIERQDDWAETVFLRLSYIHASHSDLPAAEVKYHNQCRSNFTTRNNVPKLFQSIEYVVPLKKIKHNPEELRQQAFDESIQFFRCRDDEMFTVQDVADRMTELLTDGIEAFSNKTILKKLDSMSDDIYIHKGYKKSHANHYIFRESVNKVLNDFQKNKSTKSSDKSIVFTAAKIIRSVIKECQQDADVYPSPDHVNTESAHAFIPELLSLFLKTLFVGTENDTNKQLAFIGQAIMQCTRPRSLISPLCLALGVHFHNTYQSKTAVEVLHAAGFVSSYSTVSNFEHVGAWLSGSLLQTLDIPLDAFLQFISDNADHQTRTLTGHNTFHGMATIMSSSKPLKMNTVIPRIKITTKEILQIGKIDITSYYHDGVLGPNIKFIDLKFDDQCKLKMNDFDIFWKTSLLFKTPRPGYFGTMQLVEKGENEGPGSLIFFPIINMDPTDMSCVYSTLQFILRHTSKYKVTAVVTFDFPLYWKALTIAETEKMKVVLRLGGFHTEMAWWDAVGDTMEGSGIEKVAEIVYAPNSVPHIMSGKAFARAQRFHFLNTAALHYILLSDDYNLVHDIDDMNPEVGADIETPEVSESFTDRNIFDIVFNDDESVEPQLNQVTDPPANADLIELNELFNDLTNKTDFNTEKILNSEALKRLKTKLEHKKEQLSSNPTALLWLQYIEMVDIGITFERSEHLGQWLLQLQCLKNMLAYFAATGHFLYTKGIYIYLMKMCNLENEYPDVYRHFLAGRHCVRRSDKTFGGFFSDGTIEQEFMKNFKSNGGCTRGRGVGDAQQIVWCYMAPLVAKINENIRAMTGTSKDKQMHVELFPGRQVRDTADSDNFIKYYMSHNPFQPPNVLRNIASGVNAASGINIMQCSEIGKGIIDSMIGQTACDISFSRSSKAISMMEDANPLKSGLAKIDPGKLFQRLITTSKKMKINTEDIVGSYELTTYPPSLFKTAQIMLQANKPDFKHAMCDQLISSQPPCDVNDATYIFDGGNLLHKCSWSKGQNMSQLCRMYVDYLNKYYKIPCKRFKHMIIFDGYPEYSTKDSAHLYRSKGVKGPKVNFDENTVLTLGKSLFLSNTSNKAKFILLLSKFLERAGYLVRICNSDADKDIVTSAITMSQMTNTIIVGEDTDLFVLAMSKWKQTEFRLIMQSSMSKKNANSVVDIGHVCRNTPTKVLENILFAYAFSGCDTTSRIFGYSKGPALKLLHDNSEFVECAKTFSNSNALNKNIIKAGEKAFLILYGSKHSSLDEHRRVLFEKKASQHSECVDIEKYPPTSDSASCHSLRVYHQIMDWNNILLDPAKYGFYHLNGMLLPVCGTSQIAPSKLLECIKCTCTTTCINCTCAKIDIACSDACKNCKKEGSSCRNLHVRSFD